MKNNGSFKNIGEGISSEYQDGVKVYLESGDDEYIIGRKWFSQLKDKISFEAVSDKKADGGCRLVIKKVEQSNQSEKKRLVSSTGTYYLLIHFFKTLCGGKLIIIFSLLPNLMKISSYYIVGNWKTIYCILPLWHH